MKSKVYMALAEGYFAGYGSKTMCLGIFTSKAGAEDAITKYKRFIEEANPEIELDPGYDYWIEHMVLDNYYEPRRSGLFSFANGCMVGGYTE